VAKFSERPPAKTEHPIGAALLERISWDDLRVFMVAARTLKLPQGCDPRCAPERPPCSAASSGSKKIFEFRLFDRMPEGLALTAEGRAVYAGAQKMELASHSLRAHLDQDITTRGMVRCSVTEGLGTAWILPQLAQFCRTHPSTIVDLRCAMEVADVLHMEADVAVQLQRPAARREGGEARADAPLSVRLEALHRALRAAAERRRGQAAPHHRSEGATG
jgi:DNA-binding transcriptional LysR family regulator